MSPAVDLPLRRLPSLLSVVAGAIDVIGFLGLGGLFTAQITGNLIVLPIAAGVFGVAAMAVQNALVQISLKNAPPTAVMTASFPQDRGRFLGGLALWRAACAFVATTLRNFAAYAATLAGYTG